MTGVFVAWNPKKPNGPGWIEDGSGCHVWIGARDRKGYGQVRQGRGKGRLRYVHRVRYEREIGPIPDGLPLDHFVCNNGAGGCCNPHHCRPVTRRENALRSESRAATNAAKTHCPRGHALVGDNLIASKLRRGRECRTCNTKRCAERYAANRDTVLARRRALMTPAKREAKRASDRAAYRAKRPEVKRQTRYSE